MQPSAASAAMIPVTVSAVAGRGFGDAGERCVEERLGVREPGECGDGDDDVKRGAHDERDHRTAVHGTQLTIATRVAPQVQ